MAEKHEIGKNGEAEALAYLKKHGYHIRHTNWHFQKEEIDIVAEKNNRLIFVEVKTRTGDGYGLPQDFVSRKQQKFLIRAANAYIDTYDIALEAQFDIIAITLKPEFRLEHLSEAFYP